MPITPVIAGNSSRALRRWVTVAGIGLIVLIIAADSYEAWQDYRRVINDNEHQQAALCRALAEQSARVVQETDVALAGQVLARIMRLPFIASASITDAQGAVIGHAPGAAGVGGNVADLDLFTVPMTSDGDALFIDRPQSGANPHAKTFALSRRIIDAQGQPAGIVFARIDAGYLERFYSQVSIAPGTSIRLVRGDGTILAAYPADTTATHIGDQQIIDVTQKLDEYPVQVIVSRTLSSVLRPWIQEERSSAARTLSLAVLAAILLLALRSALDRQQRLDLERHRLEQELAGVQRVEALGFLAASVAHDFNNVLTAIIGYAELVRDSLLPGSASTGNVDRLLGATERARLLVRRVLTFDPRRSVSYRSTRVEPILAEAVQQVQATLPAEIVVDLSGVSGPAQVRGDATEIYQVIMNLCTNAVHAMTGPGCLTVQLQILDVRESRSLALGELRPGQWVCLSVADTGVGLAEEQVQSIFEPFYTTRQSSHGTGIGLTVVRNIILRMAGALDVMSRFGSGTRMSVYWPALASTAVVSSPEFSTRPPEGMGQGQTVMVVDDESELVALTEELLASSGYEPVGFSDARAALEAFKHDIQRFDAVLTDERMLPMRGLEFAALVHSLRPDLPIILMTGHRDTLIDDEATRAGILEIVDKPVRISSLRDVLARHLRSGRE